MIDISTNVYSSPKRSRVQKVHGGGCPHFGTFIISSQKHTRTINRHISRIIKAKRVILHVKPAPTQKQVSVELKQILSGITFFREIILSITKCTREILSRTSTQQYNLRESPERRKLLRNLLKLHNVSKYTAIK